MKLYVANKMRGLPLYNFPWFEAAAKVLRAKGHEVVNPTEIDVKYGVVEVSRSSEGTIWAVRLSDSYDYDSVISRDLDAVSECDGIVLGPHWVLSEGARLERATAIEFGLAVFYDVESVPDVSSDPEPANWWAVTHNEPQEPEIDYPILDAVDMLRHQQVTAALDRSEGISQAEWDATVNGEVRIVDPETGGAKGSKPVQLFSAPPAGLEALGLVCGMGAGKYELHNFRKGYRWSLSADALLRHYLAWNAGEDEDPESGVNHMAHVAWHALVLIQFAQDCPDKDDRYRKDAA